MFAFFNRMANGWEMARESFRVLRMDKELVLFPLLSGVCCLMVLASFALPLFLSNADVGALFDEQQVPQNPLVYVVLFLFYFANYFVIVFFNSALVACAIIRFRGGDPTLSDGLRAASARLPQILGWALVAATVGWVLRIIESQSEKVGAIMTGLLGMAWTALTYFVVPVLVVEKAGPVEAVKRSASILGRTWGEALSANWGIGTITFLLSLLGIAPIFIGVFALETSALLGGALIASGIAWLLVVALISSTLDAIVLGALYLYAADGTVPQNFNENLLHNAFTHR